MSYGLCQGRFVSNLKKNKSILPKIVSTNLAPQSGSCNLKPNAYYFSGCA